MPTQKLKNKKVRKLIRLGNGSIALTLPIELVKKLGWKEKQKVVARKVFGGLLIKDWKK